MTTIIEGTLGNQHIENKHGQTMDSPKLMPVAGRDLDPNQRIIAKFELSFECFALNVDLNLPSTGVTVFLALQGQVKPHVYEQWLGLKN
ncbi:hypothetical protein [Vibrio algarum]|uniref:Uncharacterized protein n=1 Tax=Vibrio algarum TaxID=3020714 RepID=A0ABT4YSG6_9VIBR|nr:hypothetical protein [Vibrio sp. KJ40-1]MDB1124146.1 hypothetical protein [Vibrio sp. KJ40-1]